MGIFDFLFNRKKDIPEISKGQEAFSENKTTASGQAASILDLVELEPGRRLPGVFVDNWQQVELTALQGVAITAIPTENIPLEASKFGHYPYMPSDFEYPKDDKGLAMYPLAQINFSEVPAMPGFPGSGYLQFYISADDDLYGLDFDNMQSQKNFRILFFEEDQVTAHKADFSFLDEIMTANMIPVYKPHALSFEAKTEYIGMGDVRYDENGHWNVEKAMEKYPEIDEDSMYEAFYDNFSSTGHKIGGYATFTQEDPRIGNPPFDQYILLLQIDTDDEITWGDSGVAGFFIHPDDLAKKDFSKVMYSWDCC